MRPCLVGEQMRGRAKGYRRFVHRRVIDVMSRAARPVMCGSEPSGRRAALLCLGDMEDKVETGAACWCGGWSWSWRAMVVARRGWLAG